MKDASNEIVDAFDLHNNSSRFHVGVTRFRGSSGNQVGMTNVDAEIGTPTVDHQSGVAIHNGISNMNGAQLTNGVDIVQAINGGSAQFATGLGERPAVPNLMVLILDDDDTKGNTEIDIANAEAASGAEIFVVGVGAIASTTLDAIASEPNEDHQWYSSDYSGLLSLVDSIAQSVKDAGLFGNIYDIEITDPSGNITQCRALLTPDDDLVVLSCE